MTSEMEWQAHLLDTLGELGWAHKPGADIAPGSGEREAWSQLHLPSRLDRALRRLNPQVPPLYLTQAIDEITRPRSNDAITENQRVHEWLVNGYRGITYLDDAGREQTPTIRVISAEPADNDWLVADEVTIRGERNRRFDAVLYCNGLPVSIVELKRGGSEHTGPDRAHNQLATYLAEFPMAFRYAVFDLVSDGISARYGTPFTPYHHWSPWNVDDAGAELGPDAVGVDGQPLLALDAALFGLYDQLRFLQLMRDFTAFDGGDQLAKRVAKPHQYFAVTKAVGSTVQAVETDGKAGVVWHTQGSGKSMEMELYAARIMRHPKLLNPTIVVITDRTELDGQLFEAFNRSLLLPEKPKQIKTRRELREELTNRVTGGIFFTTLQKFGRTDAERGDGEEHPLLSKRRNIIVIVDEAHRSHYDDLDGYARHLRDALPNATLIAFTGTPISFADRNTRVVFGDYIDIYDLTRAVADGATVPVYFEPRLIKVALAEGVSQEQMDSAADEATKDLDDVERARVEASVAVVNAVYGAPQRISALAQDLVAHWEARRELMRPMISGPGKGMIVAGTRDICVSVYDALVALRPEWHSPDLTGGRIKIVYSGTPADPPRLRAHVRRDSDNAVIKQRLKDPDDELELVIVQSMMLTGYDSPPLHTLYLDRPLRGALLMQTLARVNRTFRGKDAGLLVGYAPLTENLQAALAEYTARDQADRPVGRGVEEAVALVETLLGDIRELLRPFAWQRLIRPDKPMSVAQAAQATANFLRSPASPGNEPARPTDGEKTSETLRDQYRRKSRQLASAWSLAAGSADLKPLGFEVRYYEEVRVYMAKFDADDARAEGRPIPEDIARLLSALIADSTSSGEVLDIYAAAGLAKPELSKLTPEYVQQAQQARNPHLAIEALRNLVLSETRRVTGANGVRERQFSERVTELMNRYANQQLTAAEIIAELIELAKEIHAEPDRGARFTPPLATNELSLYDAIALNESAVTEMGDDLLAQIARELVAILRRDVRTDWTVRDDVRAKLRSSIRRLLIKYRYPPDEQQSATKLVMDQMELMAARMTDAG